MNPNRRYFVYIHDRYGNEPYIVREGGVAREWSSLKALGGDWAEIGDLRLSGDAFQNDLGEDVFLRVSQEVLDTYSPRALAQMPGIEKLTLPIPLATAILDARHQ